MCAYVGGPKYFLGKMMPAFGMGIEYDPLRTGENFCDTSVCYFGYGVLTPKLPFLIDSRITITTVYALPCDLYIFA